MPVSPAELRHILAPALAPCRHFSGCCRSFAVWEPKIGHIPRGFGGAYRAAESMRLILVTAEPGDPGDTEHYAGTPSQMLDRHLALFDEMLRTGSLRRNSRPTPFHRSLRTILDLCWPGLTLDEQLARTWFTNAVKCSAPTSGGAIPGEAALTCVTNYAGKEISALPRAFVLALGEKAQGRLRKAGVRVDTCAQHPSARPNTKPLVSWEKAAQEFRRWLADSDVTY